MKWIVSSEDVYYWTNFTSAHKEIDIDKESSDEDRAIN